MARKRKAELTTIEVAALVQGDRVLLLDRSGKRIGCSVLADRIGRLDDNVAAKLLWQKAAERMLAAYWEESFRRNLSGWGKKAASLAASCRLRLLDQQRPRNRTSVVQTTYATTTWQKAAQRMWHQANNRFRLHARSGWRRWASSVANNSNKRKGGRYAQSNHG